VLPQANENCSPPLHLDVCGKRRLSTLTQQISAFPYIVLDVNVLRDIEKMSELISHCEQSDLCLLLPDAVGFEQCKSIPHAFDTMSGSLMLLAKHPQLVSVARRLPDMRREEIANKRPIETLIEQSATEIFRDTLACLDNGDDSRLREMLCGEAFENRVQESLDLWNDYEKLRSVLKTLATEIEHGASPELLKRARSATGDQQSELVIEVLSTQTCMAYGFQNLRRQGLTDIEAIALLRSHSIELRFLLGLFSVAAIWLCRGGLDTAKGSKISNDLTDMEYAILASVCKRFASDDKKALITSQVIRVAHENWCSKIGSLLAGDTTRKET
jgi:hypothetical protein